MFGFLNVNKPSGMTSHKVISVLRKITGVKQIGHAGTLDPLASGVLPVAIGKAAKLIDYLDEDKEYIALMQLGQISDTYDVEGNVENTAFRKINIEEIQQALKNFRGDIIQIPPAYSAVHYNGKRLYELARKGTIPDDIPSRKITVFKNEIVFFDYEKQMLKLDIACSKGTYIRSVIHDLGQTLGSGAVMYELTRTKSASMKIENSIELSEGMTKGDIKNNLVRPEDILSMPFVEINPADFERVKNGNKFVNIYNVNGFVILTNENNPIALALAAKDFIQPKKLLI